MQSGIKNTAVAFLMLLYMKRVVSPAKRTQNVLFISAEAAAPEALRTCGTDGSASHTDTSISAPRGSIIPGWLVQRCKLEALCLVRRRINTSKEDIMYKAPPKTTYYHIPLAYDKKSSVNLPLFIHFYLLYFLISPSL